MAKVAVQNMVDFQSAMTNKSHKVREQETIKPFVGKTLWDFLSKVPDDSRVLFYIGTGSGFHFIGTKEDYLRDEKRIKGKSKRQIADLYLRDRKIKDIYIRIQGGYAIILEGDEQGAYWTFNEYKAR